MPGALTCAIYSQGLSILSCLPSGLVEKGGFKPHLTSFFSKHFDPMLVSSVELDVLSRKEYETAQFLKS